MRNVAYLTFNDQPGGIYNSQVVDVCRYYRDELKVNIHLIAFISLRNLRSTKARILSQWPEAIVLPMWPGVHRWKRNSARLKSRLRKLKTDLVIARGPFATVLAQQCAGVKVCFDARGAYVPEFTEYDVSSGKISVTEIRELEKRALEESFACIAVSNALVDYWKREYNYTADKHVIIPCTLVALPQTDFAPSTGKVRIVFAGGSGKWQSLHLLDQLLGNLFITNENVHLLMLSRTLPDDFALKSKYPDRVEVRWVSEVEVQKEFSSCDYGWMVRENTVTNQVASPVKFAEYLAGGLSVITSENLGDFSEFVKQHQCGMIAGAAGTLKPEPVSEEQKQKNRALAGNYFMKENYRQEYLQIVS